MEKLSQSLKDLIDAPLPAEAISDHPTKPYLSSIKAIYVTERMNQVFWVGGWTLRVKPQERLDGWMVVVHVTFEVPEYWIYYECFGGNDNWGWNSKNFDLGDAYKWATTDAITKIGSWLWIGADVFKWKKWKQSVEKSDTSTSTWNTVAWFNKNELKKCVAEWFWYSKEAIEQWAKDNSYRLSWPSRSLIDAYLSTGEL